MAIVHVTGSTDPVVTGESTIHGDQTTKVVVVEGPMSLLEEVSDVSSFVPYGFEYVTHRTIQSDGGFGKIEITCKDLGDSQTTAPERTTWRIQMASVQKALKFHPMCVSGISFIEAWLNTEPLKRFDSDGGPQYVDSSGTAHSIDDEDAIRFARAYSKGVDSYVEYYPVLQKISFYKRLPGVSVVGTSTTSGTVSAFSDAVGKWDVPAVMLNGYGDTGWFKSGDSYEQDGSLKWTRTEEWTWSPNDSEDEDTGWIYERSED